MLTKTPAAKELAGTDADGREEKTAGNDARGGAAPGGSRAEVGKPIGALVAQIIDGLKGVRGSPGLTVDATGEPAAGSDPGFRPDAHAHRVKGPGLSRVPARIAPGAGHRVIRAEGASHGAAMGWAGAHKCACQMMNAWSSRYAAT